MQTILKFHNFNINLTTHEHESQCCVAQISKSLKVCENIVISNSKIKVDENANSIIIEKLFDKNYIKNLVFNKVLKTLRNDDTHFKDLTLNNCKKIENRLYYRKRKYVSTYHLLKLRFLKLHHNFLVDDH